MFISCILTNGFITRYCQFGFVYVPTITPFQDSSISLQMRYCNIKEQQTISNSHVNIVILLSNLWSWVGGNVAKDIHNKHTYNT